MRFFFLIKEGILGFKRARLAALIAVFTITLSLSLIGVFGVVVQNLSDVFHRFYKRVQLEVFIDPSLTEKGVSALTAEIKKIPAVQSVVYISPDEALKAFEEDFGEDLIAVLESNPLPPSLRIVLNPDFSKLEAIEEVVQQIKLYEEVDEVLYQREIIRLLNRYFWMGIIASISLGIVIFLISTLLIFNTIRLTIHARSVVIEIMKLVGATNLFIKGPFIVEGILQGFLGGLLACGLLWLQADVVQTVLATKLRIPVQIYLFLLSTGTFLGFLGSYFSVNKYLKY